MATSGHKSGRLSPVKRRAGCIPVTVACIASSTNMMPRPDVHHQRNQMDRTSRRILKYVVVLLPILLMSPYAFLIAAMLIQLETRHKMIPKSIGLLHTIALLAGNHVR